MVDRMSAIRQEIFMFIKNYGENRRVRMINIQLFSDKKRISRREMGIAIQDLKDKKAIFYNPRRGWIAR